MSAAFDPKDPRYDQSGKYPIDEDGWQIVGPFSALFIGGPAAYKVITPTMRYYFGMSIKQDPAYGNDHHYCLGVITSFGVKKPAYVENDGEETDYNIVFKSDEERQIHEKRVQEYLFKCKNDSRYSDYPKYNNFFTGVEFSAGRDVQIEVF